MIPAFAPNNHVIENLNRLRTDIQKIVPSAIAAADPVNAIKSSLRYDGRLISLTDRIIDLDDIDNVWVVGAGKGSAKMAQGLEEILGDRIKGGLVSIKKGYEADLKHIELAEGGHPIPDMGSLRSAEKTIAMADRLGRRDLVFCLISGGASAIWTLPAKGLTPDDIILATKLLVESGANIHEINFVRKHLSAISGGQLTQAFYPAKLVTLIISDVIGDDMSVIGSGPTVPDSSTFTDALTVLAKYNLRGKFPRNAIEHLQAGARGGVAETPKPGQKIFRGNIWQIVASNKIALEAASKTAQEAGYNVHILTDRQAGEARYVGYILGHLARGAADGHGPIGLPAALISGGETTVTVKGGGLGGRNQELVLSAAVEIAGKENIVVASFGTDGIDGPTDAAGAVADGLTVSRAEAAGLSASDYLSDNNSYRYFERLGDLIKTGPTGTNVMDIQIALISDQ